MTQKFGDDWKQIPVTVLELGSTVLAKKGKKKAYIGIGKRNNARNTDAGQYKDLKYVPQKVVEVRSENYKELKVGDELPLDKLVGAKVSIQGISKGKGFAGVHKRFDVKGGPETHGQKDTHRHVGSIGAQTPGKVWKGQKMPGRHGQYTTTIKTKIVDVDEKKRLISVKGGTPGGRNSIVKIVVTKFGAEPKKESRKKKSKKE